MGSASFSIEVYLHSVSYLMNTKQKPQASKYHYEVVAVQSLACVMTYHFGISHDIIVGLNCWSSNFSF